LRLGVCVPSEIVLAQIQRDASAAGRGTRRSGPLAQAATALKKAGADFLELPVTALFNQGQAASWGEMAQRLALPVEAFHTLFPAPLKVAGPEVDRGRVDGYMRHSFAQLASFRPPASRPSAVGPTAIPPVVVFGSGKARAIPDEFPKPEAEQQLLWTLHRAADQARANGLRVALEPLARGATNLVNNLLEALALVERVGRNENGITADTTQMEREGEPLEHLPEVSRYLLHVHLAGREFSPPEAGNGDFAGLFHTLARVSYRGRVSIECTWSDFAAQAPEAIAFLKEVMQECQP